MNQLGSGFQQQLDRDRSPAFPTSYDFLRSNEIV